MELTFLGTSSAAPTAERNVTGMALRIDGNWDLFDCGEATQHQLRHTPLSLVRLRRIFISHLHGDHCFGLFGLLASRSMDGATTAVSIFGPVGLRSMVDIVLSTSDTYLTFPLEIVEVGDDGGRVGDDGEMTIDAVPVSHRVPSFAWWLRERERPGYFDVAAARQAGVPEGPLFGRLQRGEAVALDDGRVVHADTVLGPSRPGRRIVIAGDNRSPLDLFEHTGGADVAVHESTYTEPVLAAIGDDRGHSTAARVAQAAQRTGVRNLVLTHFSARYGSRAGGLTIDDVRIEATSHFNGALYLANDFDRITIAPDGSVS